MRKQRNSRRKVVQKYERKAKQKDNKLLFALSNFYNSTFLITFLVEKQERKKKHMDQMVHGK